METNSDLLFEKNGKTCTVPVTTIDIQEGQTEYKNEQLIIEKGIITDRKPYEGVTDLFVSAGFINCHVHWLMDTGTGSFDHMISDIAGNPERKTEEAIEYARSTLKLGITFACDKGPPGYCGMPVYHGMMQAISKGELMTGFIYSTWAFMCEGGFGYPYGRIIHSIKDMEVALLELDATGAGTIKFIPEGPFDTSGKKYRFVFSKEAFYTARAASRSKNMVFAVHAKGKESLDRCIEVEADCVEHGVTATPEQLLAFQDKNIYLGPTLDGLLCRLEYAKESGTQLDTASYDWDQVCRMVKMSTTLNNGRPFTHMLFASDAGSYATPHASLRELYLMRKMGYSAPSVLEMATVNGAKCLKHKDKGTIQKGKRADLIFWKTNPLELTLDKWQSLDTYIAGVALNGVLTY
jgi:imidazolonepropionase-like amidohydrolase